MSKNSDNSNFTDRLKPAGGFKTGITKLSAVGSVFKSIGYIGIGAVSALVAMKPQEITAIADELARGISEGQVGVTNQQVRAVAAAISAGTAAMGLLHGLSGILKFQTANAAVRARKNAPLIDQNIDGLRMQLDAMYRSSPMGGR